MKIIMKSASALGEAGPAAKTREAPSGLWKALLEQP